MPTPFNVNGWELVVIAVLFLLLFGPEKLPEIAMQAGRLFRELRQAAETATNELTRELQRAADENLESSVDVRELGDSARRVIQDRSKIVTDLVKDQLRDVNAEIGSIAPAIAAPVDTASASEAESVAAEGIEPGDEPGDAVEDAAVEPPDEPGFASDTQAGQAR